MLTRQLPVAAVLRKIRAGGGNLQRILPLRTLCSGRHIRVDDTGLAGVFLVPFGSLLPRIRSRVGVRTRGRHETGAHREPGPARGTASSRVRYAPMATPISLEADPPETAATSSGWLWSR